MNLTILFVSPGGAPTKFTLPTFSPVVKLVFEDIMRKRYVIFRLAIDSDKFYLWVHIGSDSFGWDGRTHLGGMLAANLSGLY